MLSQIISIVIDIGLGAYAVRLAKQDRVRIAALEAQVVAIRAFLEEKLNYE